jgi:hypothetical protein
VRKKIKTISLFLLFLGLVFIINLMMKSPSNQRKWQEQYQILPSVGVTAETIQISHLRDFRFDKSGRVLEKRYLDKSYQLEDLKSTWAGISHFGGPGLAHVFMSFEFSDSRYLVVSIEARLTVDDVSYQPFSGLFRRYTKTVVLATEQDVIGLRTHIRGEKVYLYKLRLSQLQQVSLLLDFLNVAQTLRTEPEFYNTLLDNCMTGLLARTERFRSWVSWLDYRIMLPGYSDRLGYDMGLIDNSEPLQKVRGRALINPSNIELEDRLFSIKIRQ